MEERWGWLLPVRPFDKGHKALENAGKKHCILNDTSFMECIHIKGEISAVLSTLRLVTKPEDSALIEQPQGIRELEIDLMNPSGDGPETRKSLIAPCRLLWRAPEEDGNPKGSGEVWLWIHTCALEEGISALELARGAPQSVLSIAVESPRLSRLELRGRNAQRVVAAVCKLHPSVDGSPEAWHETLFSGMQEDGEVVMVGCVDPKP